MQKADKLFLSHEPPALCRFNPHAATALERQARRAVEDEMTELEPQQRRQRESVYKPGEQPLHAIRLSGLDACGKYFRQRMPSPRPRRVLTQRQAYLRAHSALLPVNQHQLAPMRLGNGACERQAKARAAGCAVA